MSERARESESARARARERERETSQGCKKLFGKGSEFGLKNRFKYV